jgi:hypothetical protein
MARVAALFVLAATLICLNDALTVPKYASRVYPQKQTTYGVAYVPGNAEVQIVLTDKGVWITGGTFRTYTVTKTYILCFK